MYSKSLGINLLFILVLSLVFLNLTTYLGSLNLVPFPSYIIDIALFLFFSFLYFKRRLAFPWENKIFIWLAYYLIINIIYFIFSPNGIAEYKYFKLILFFSFFIMYMVMFFALDDDKLSKTSYIMIFLGVIASISLIVDYVSPGYFFTVFGAPLPDSYETGRAASMYLNANIAGGAMVLFLIFTIDSIPRKWRIFYISVLFLGLFATMSRSNIMIFFLVLSFMFFQKKLIGVQISILAIVIVIFFSWLATGGLETLGDTFEFKVTENMKSRVNFFADGKKSDTGDMAERKEVLKAALEMFMQRPVLGNGFATTRTWHHRVGPHNTFAMQWAEMGIWGMLIVPLLFLFSTFDVFKYGSSNQKHIAILVIIFFTFSCFFSHNMFDQQLDIAALVAVSVMGYKSRKKVLNAVNARDQYAA